LGKCGCRKGIFYLSRDRREAGADQENREGDGFHVKSFALTTADGSALPWKAFSLQALFPAAPSGPVNAAASFRIGSFPPGIDCRPGRTGRESTVWSEWIH